MVYYHINYTRLGSFCYSDLLILKQYGFKIERVEQFKMAYVATNGVNLGGTPLNILKSIIQMVDDEKDRNRLEKALDNPESKFIAIASDKPIDEMQLKPSKSDKPLRRAFDKQLAQQTHEYIEKNISNKDLVNTTLAQLVEAFQYGFGNDYVEEVDEIDERIIDGGNAFR